MGVLDTALCLNWLQTPNDPQTPPPDLTTSPEFMPLARQVFANGQPVRQTIELAGAMHAHRLDLILTPMLGTAGETTGVFVGVLDLTETRRVEQARRESENQFRLMFDLATVGMAVIEPSTRRVLRVNQRLCRILGYEADELLGMSFLDLTYPEDRQHDRRRFRRAVLQLDTDYFTEKRYVRKDGTVVWALVNATFIRDPNGYPVRAVAAIIDITDRREAERRKDEFLAVLGHELRNPMAPIRHAVEILQALGVNGDPRVNWAIKVLDRQTAHMGRLLDDLLDVSRIVQGRIELETVELQVRELLQQAADGVRALMDEHRHRFVCRLPPSAWRVLGDPVRLSQILLNILVNAANYTPPRGEIRLESRIEGESVLIEVRDNGQGMTAEQLDSLFGLFTRGPHACDTASGGLGLGLAIARRLTELHGGSLDARSEGLGRGTELCLRLPILTGAPPSSLNKRLDAPAASPSGEKPQVLVVDDDPDVVDALAMLLEILGYPVAVARSGPEALELARQQCPRVALLDIGLPGMDGLEIARRLRAQYPDPECLKLVALTGLGHEEARERSLAAGFDEHLVKPLGRQALLALLESVEQ
ncbi:PAS domain S-box protein [Allochromatium palmeri]|uniref:histidine kinase n=1 Tax=Allochromatium palmeri TaxID=231048 RepID=A0A6N8EBE3_9GAMM|nr:PAS domain S-box protein [Allochromatium palmeri]